MAKITHTEVLTSTICSALTPVFYVLPLYISSTKSLLLHWLCLLWNFWSNWVFSISISSYSFSLLVSLWRKGGLILCGLFSEGKIHYHNSHLTQLYFLLMMYSPLSHLNYFHWFIVFTLPSVTSWLKCCPLLYWFHELFIQLQKIFVRTRLTN